jgi:hypothetical protein
MTVGRGCAVPNLRVWGKLAGPPTPREFGTAQPCPTVAPRLARGVEFAAHPRAPGTAHSPDDEISLDVDVVNRVAELA